MMIMQLNINLVKGIRYWAFVNLLEKGHNINDRSIFTFIPEQNTGEWNLMYQLIFDLYIMPHQYII